MLQRFPVHFQSSQFRCFYSFYIRHHESPSRFVIVSQGFLEVDIDCAQCLILAFVCQFVKVFCLNFKYQKNILRCFNILGSKVNDMLTIYVFDRKKNSSQSYCDRLFIQFLCLNLINNSILIRLQSGRRLKKKLLPVMLLSFHLQSGF